MRKALQCLLAYDLALSIYKKHNKEADRQCLKQHQAKNQLPSNCARPQAHLPTFHFLRGWCAPVYRKCSSYFEERARAIWPP